MQFSTIILLALLALVQISYQDRLEKGDGLNPKLSGGMDLVGKTELAGDMKNGIIKRLISTTVIDPDQIRRRVKRQYFKPSIDGSMLANERVKLLRRIQVAEKSVSTTTTEAPVTTSTIAPSDVNNNQTTIFDLKPKSEVTVSSLSSSLVGLFDKLVGVLKRFIN